MATILSRASKNAHGGTRVSSLGSVGSSGMVAGGWRRAGEGERVWRREKVHDSWDQLPRIDPRLIPEMIWLNWLVNIDSNSRLIRSTRPP
jgi:hypothetical protein